MKQSRSPSGVGRSPICSAAHSDKTLDNCSFENPMSTLTGEVFERNGATAFAIPPVGTPGAIKFELLNIHGPGVNFASIASLLVDGMTFEIDPELCKAPFDRLADCLMFAVRQRLNLPFFPTPGSNRNTITGIKATFPPPPHPEAEDYLFFRRQVTDLAGRPLEIVMIDKVSRLQHFKPWDPASLQLAEPAQEGSPWTYRQVAGFFNSQAIYDLAIQDFDKCQSAHGVFVEIGAYLGRSTAYLASKTCSRPISLFVVDVWRGPQNTASQSDLVQSMLLRQIDDDLFPVFLDNMEKCGLIHSMMPLRMRSTEAAMIFREESVDFCFIDGAHDYQSVKEDIATWYPKVRSGGLIGGDDYRGEYPGVDLAVNEHFQPLGGVATDGRCWYFRKPHSPPSSPLSQ
jgi:hypothetical protein